MRIGIGYDSHRLVHGRNLVLGGVHIPYEKGLMGHSDADVLCHAIIDSLIGALGHGDIGRLFSDTDPRWKDASSISLLAEVMDLVSTNGYSVAWIDSVIIAESPGLSAHISAMKDAISTTGILADGVNIKAKTNEGMGFIGQGEGIAAYAVCLLTPSD